MASRAEKEAFVTGHSGTTWLEILLISVVFIAGWVLYVLGSWLVRVREGSAASWAIGTLTLLGTSLLSLWFPQDAFTSTNDGVHQLNILLLMLGITVILLVSTQQRQHAQTSWREAYTAQDVHPKSCVTLFRACITAYTCIAILAVDFPFFPRRLAKAETFGTGLMDVGPGVFVFSSGLGLGLRLLRLADSRSADSSANRSGDFTFDASSTPVLLLRAAKSVGPLLLLGLARMVLTKAVDYQEHHSEYGVHWNFFFTLAYVACMGAFAPRHGLGAAGGTLLAGTMHQVLLSQPGVSEWLSTHERDMTSFVDANKEGLVSLGGYSALFYAGSAFASIVQGFTASPPITAPKLTVNKTYEKASSSTSQDADLSEPAQGGRIAGVWWWHARLWFAAASLWLAAYLCDGYIQPLSRRFCNAAYVLWVSAMAATQIAFAALSTSVTAVATAVPRPRCVVAEGLSDNQLVAFLLANVLTGAVNLSMDTIHSSPVFATIVMLVYSALWGCAGLWVQLIKKLGRGKAHAA